MCRTGVSALIFNESDELLLVNLDSFEEQYFAVPGDGLEPEESREEAVFREIFEELGIPKESLVLVGKSDNPLRFLFKQIVLARDGKEYEGQDGTSSAFVLRVILMLCVQKKEKSGSMRGYLLIL